MVGEEGVRAHMRENCILLDKENTFAILLQCVPENMSPEQLI